MRKDVIEMLNHISVEEFLVANPNSSTCNKAFKEIFKGLDFLNEFYIVSNKTIERLSQIAYVSNDITKNTIFITGYRGCGKTCFMNFLDSIIMGKYILKEYDEYLDLNIELIKSIFIKQKQLSGNYFYNEEQDEIEKLKNVYLETKEKIYVDLEAQLELYSENYKDTISGYINNCLKGKSIYLNFEKGANSDSTPFNTKFIKQICGIIKSVIMSDKNLNEKNPFASLYDLYERYEEEFENTFENRNEIFEFMEFVNKKLIGAKRFNDIRYELNDKLYKMSLEQLLMILVLLYISIELCLEDDKKEYKKIFILLDNMDIIYRQSLLNETMHSYSYFIENMNSLMEELEKKGAKDWNLIYENITFIYAMRETTAMQVSDHFKDGMEQNVFHFDMSMDTNKSLIVERKYQFVNDYIEEIENKVMLQILKDVYQICTDSYTKENIFPMFNNDFKRAIFCISKICQENRNILAQHNEIIKYNKHFTKNGSRGIVYRLIYDKFKAEHYFEKIGIEPYHAKFTPSRIVLTILYNFLPDDENEDSKRLVPANTNMRTLFTYASYVLDTEMFINAIIGMFSLRVETYWNHLITFDNVKDVTYDGLKLFITDYINNKTISSDIKLRITDAGKNYLKEMCTHFEFFSCRFCENSMPLFCKENFAYINTEDKYVFEKLIEAVFNEVENCCRKLNNNYNTKIYRKYKGVPNKSLLKSKYVFRNKSDEIGILHEERIIHKHIRYIDNFRLYIIQYIYPEKRMDLNKRLFALLEKYIGLLDAKYIPNRSKKLSVAFRGCIKYIVETKKYDDMHTEVSEKSYKELKEAKCL